jgi:predicted metal-binding protein
MAKIGIMTCGNMKNELSCSAVGCFRSFNGREGRFNRYQDDKEFQLVGLSTCAGCPTLLAPEKILNKVKPLVEMSQAEIIHFSTCMVNLCPFVNQYRTAINAKYPQVEVVMGTDAPSEALLEALKGSIKKLLTEDQPDLTAEFKKVIAAG